MNLLASDAVALPPSLRFPWETANVVHLAGAEPWLRAARRRIDVVRDDQNHRMPLRAELWLTVTPPRFGGTWRCEADALGSELVGRGSTADEAIQDWRKRFRMTAQRFMEMRPFEMTEADSELWARLQAVIDVPRYKATKPMVIRQVGAVVKKRPGLIVVVWEDGARERVDPDVFDETFSRFGVGQAFEATVTRNAYTFRMLRADAVRKLSAVRLASPDKVNALWDRVVGDAPPAKGDIDEDFWLKQPE